MLKRLFILVCIWQAVVAMDSMQDFPQRHMRSNSGSPMLVPLPYPSCQATDNRVNDKDENKDKSSTSQSDRLIERGRTLIAIAMGRLYRCLPQ